MASENCGISASPFFSQKPIKKKKMLTLLTFHRDESCLSLGTALPAKKLLIRFPSTGETESGLRGAILTSRAALSGSPLTLCRQGRSEFSQANTLRLSAKPKQPQSPCLQASLSRAAVQETCVSKILTAGMSLPSGEALALFFGNQQLTSPRGST